MVDGFREKGRWKHTHISLGKTLQDLQELLTEESWLSHRELITTLKKAHVCTCDQGRGNSETAGEDGRVRALEMRSPKEVFKGGSCLS